MDEAGSGKYRYNGEYWENNQKLAAEFATFAAGKSITPAQLAIALEENAAAVDVTLSSEEIEEVEALIKKYPNIGPRYSARENKFVDKE